jgi:hypothetical protein
MKNTISDIAKELEILAANPPYLGLKNSGLTGISLFFFLYARFTGEEKYGELANEALERTLAHAHHYINYYFASDFADIGRVVDLLANEKFLEVETSEFAGYFEEPLMHRLKEDIGVDFGFCTGTIGICDLFLNKANHREALDITFGHIYSGLKIKRYPKHPVETLFLFPSEILRDVKLFFLKLEKMNIPFPQKKLLYNAIRKFESQKMLHSNCPEYYVLQDLREAGLMEDKQRMQTVLEKIAAGPSDLVFKGLASIALENESLAEWWKVV